VTHDPQTGVGGDRVPWVVGVSGASGTPYAAAVLRGLLAAGLPVDLVLSRAARLTLLDETGIAWHDVAWQQPLESWLSAPLGGPVSESAGTSRSAVPVETLVAVHAPGNLAAPTSSGSYPTRGMIVVPASTACLAGIALGLSKDLLQRSADVTLKEGRSLIVVPREMPYTGATLRHMLTLHDAGVVVAAASPGFYAGARTAADLVDFVAGRVLDAAGVDHALFRRWTGELGRARRPDQAARRTS
jgi:4-hydroxy-3-polyprenylbenzoate decarboxylase